MVTILVLVTGLSATGPLDDFHWREECRETKSWTAQPSWLGNASSSASVTGDGEAIVFRVTEPGRGMKWSFDIPVVSLDATPWLMVRYRTENLNNKRTDYLIYVDDRVPGRQLDAIRLCDVTVDGEWHVAAVDLSLLTEADGIYALAVQVQALPQKEAAVRVDWITLADRPARGAEVIRRSPAVDPKPDWVAPLAEASWEAHRDWLANPAPDGEHGAGRQGGATVFRVRPAGRGMKWSWNLPEAVSLKGHRYVSIRYRATGWRTYSDYAVCVFGKAAEKDDPGYAAMIPAGELLGDTRWHTLNLDVRRLANRYPTITGLAVQLQAESDGASLELSDLRLTNARQPSKLSDAVNWKAGGELQRFQALTPWEVAAAESRPWRKHLQLSDWFAGPAVTVQGIPFSRTDAEPALATTGVRAKSELRWPTKCRASEVYLLLLAALVGPDEPAYGGGKFQAIRDVDRFRIRLEYADGSANECLPMNVATRRFGIVRGVQVVVAAANPEKELCAIVLSDRSKQAAFAVAGMTFRTHGPRAHPEVLEEHPTVLSRPRPATQANRGSEPTVPLEAEIPSSGPPVMKRLIHQPTAWDYLPEPCPLVRLRVDGREIAAEDLVRTDAFGDERDLLGFTWFDVRGHDGLHLGFSAEPVGADGLKINATVRNLGRKERAVLLAVPVVGPYRLGENPDDPYYLVPRRGSVLGNSPRSFRERYSGLFPLQFLDTFCPSGQRGLVLRTEDITCLPKHYLLEKHENGTFTVGVDYPERILRPGEALSTAPAVISATDGDWRRGFTAYRRWVATWYKPLAPRKKWFREVFNFRQRFLWTWDPLYDAKQGQFQLQRAVDEARREFGGIDYLHLFDWGYVRPYGRIYGRTGDVSPYPMFQGGQGAFRRAIAEVQAQGIPVGLYIEGYLLEERGKLGQQYGRQWQLVGRDGKGVYWPQSSEMMICAAVDAWRKVQASTYAAKVRELNVDGMYIDQFGFANPGKDCYGREHGHPVPSYAVVAERDATRIIRQSIEAVKSNVAVYTEETPADVTSQYQDGSFSYAMFSAQRTRTMVPLNLARFALPDFKTIQILYCDKPTGSWATGVRWVFFGGEAIWLEGKADEWFEPETREEIRRCYAILRKHRDAFTTLHPEPLVPTGQGRVFANRFPVDGKTVYTIYNARHSTVRGPVLRLRHHEGASYFDAWHNRPAELTRDGDHDVISTEVGPHGVGCVVVESSR